MTKLIALLLALILTLSLAACGNAPSDSGDNGAETSTAAKSFAEPLPTTTATMEVPVPGPIETTDSTATPDPDNVFVNSTNFAEDIGNVSVKPYRVYWEDGCLIAECFVINGLDAAVYNINVKSLAFNNETDDIASASFGVLQDLVIAPHSYVVWTFCFGEDCIITPYADLGFLGCDASTSYNY